MQYSTQWDIHDLMPSPLSSTTFWILTALTGGRRHGYDILGEVESASAGAVVLKVTTLYAALERMEREGLIHPDGDEIVNGRARRYYRISDSGDAALDAAVESLERQARVARDRIAGRPVSGGRLAFA